MKRLVFTMFLLLSMFFSISACSSNNKQKSQSTTQHTIIEVTIDNYDYYLTEHSYVINDSIDSRLGVVMGLEFNGAIYGIYDVTIYYEETYVVTERYELHLNCAGYGTISYLTTRNFKIVDVVGTIVINNC